MQLRVVTDQPWDVAADVLAIPIVGEPAFDGPLGEIDRRVGGELTSLAAFKEVSGKRYWTAVVASGELRVVIDREFPLAEAAEAHRYIESRRAFGRVLLVP